MEVKRRVVRERRRREKRGLKRGEEEGRGEEVRRGRRLLRGAILNSIFFSFLHASSNLNVSSPIFFFSVSLAD